jgi:hypothetical protein
MSLSLLPRQFTWPGFSFSLCMHFMRDDGDSATDAALRIAYASGSAISTASPITTIFKISQLGHCYTYFGHLAAATRSGDVRI